MTLDLLDRKIAHALQLDGRAAFSTIGAALRVSDQTVARRYRRLRAGGVARVVGLPDAKRLGQTVWLLRLTCVPDAATPLAEALARRTDTSWVSLTSGGTEIVCFARSRGLDPHEPPLLGRLPRTPRVVAITAHCLLRLYFGGAAGWNRRTDALTSQEIEQLRPTLGEPDDTPVRLSTEDEAMLAELARDGRTSYPRLATVTGWSVSTAQRRLDHLRRAGAVYFDVDTDPAVFGYPTEALLWMSVPPAHLARVGSLLAEHAEVALAAATTGPTNLVASVGCDDVDSLYDYVATRLATIDAVHHLETAPIVRTIKRAGTVFT